MSTEREASCESSVVAFLYEKNKIDTHSIRIFARSVLDTHHVIPPATLENVTVCSALHTEIVTARFFPLSSILLFFFSTCIFYSSINLRVLLFQPEACNVSHQLPQLYLNGLSGEVRVCAFCSDVRV